MEYDGSTSLFGGRAIIQRAVDQSPKNTQFTQNLQFTQNTQFYSPIIDLSQSTDLKICFSQFFIKTGHHANFE